MTTASDREILNEAHERGAISTFFAFFRLSGPGWLQSAITLGGGSLASALYLGVIGGYSLLWLQVLAIFIGVVMLSAISYVTLTTGRRPYEAINEYVNPVLGVGWVLATILANMIWIMPQFSLAYDALDRNLLGDQISPDSLKDKIVVSLILFGLAFTMIYLSARGGLLSRIFDWILKLIVGGIVLCFVGVVVFLFYKGALAPDVVFSGFIPSWDQFWNPAPQIQELIAQLPEAEGKDWTNDIVEKQQRTMISGAATAVGINMTFLLPYSMLSRGWDRPFRGLARFDLITGMAIPFVFVTSCIVISASYSFHAKLDDKLVSSDPEVVKESPFFEKVSGEFANVLTRKEIKGEDGEPVMAPANAIQAEIDDLATAHGRGVSAEREKIKGAFGKALFDVKNFFVPAEESDVLKAKRKELATLKNDIVAKYSSEISDVEKKLILTMINPNTTQLALSLKELLGENAANYVFGIGAFAMGFSTMIILMMINGFAIREIFGKPNSTALNLFGAFIAGVAGVMWIWVWKGESKTWAIIMASTFGVILLPVAYVAFFALMNNKRLLGDDKPTGIKMALWNVLMVLGVFFALAAAFISIRKKLGETGGEFILGAVVTFGILVVIGFSARLRKPSVSE